MAPATGAAQGLTAPPETPPHLWLDPEGETLPFRSDDEIAEFLRTARP